MTARFFASKFNFTPGGRRLKICLTVRCVSPRCLCNFKEERMGVTLEDMENWDFGSFVKAQKNKSEPRSSDLFEVGDPYGYLRYPKGAPRRDSAINCLARKEGVA